MNIVEKIDNLRIARNWTIYKLAQETGLTQQTIHQWFDGHTTPTIPALKSVCAAYGINLSEFFAEGEVVELTPELQSLYTNWCCLTKEEQSSVKLIIENYLKNK